MEIKNDRVFIVIVDANMEKYFFEDSQLLDAKLISIPFKGRIEILKTCY